MLRAQLGNEFGNPKSQDYKTKQEAFDTYNSLIEKVPATVMRIMSRLAIGEATDNNDRLESTIERAALRVLDVTNHGTQIGIALPAREATWAQIFEDEGHQNAAREYHALRNHEKASSETIAACRKRGFETLKVVARTHSDIALEQEDNQLYISSHPTAA